MSAFGQPFRYSKAEREKVAQGDYSDYAKDVVDALEKDGVASAIVYGFSEGGAIAPDVALEMLRRGIDVESVIIGSTPNVNKQRGALKLAKDFIDFKALKEIQETQELSPALKESAVGRKLGSRALNLAKVTCVDTVGMLATIGVRMLRPTSLAFGRGFAYGKWLSSKTKTTETNPHVISNKIKLLLQLKPDLAITFFTGENDKIGDPFLMKKLAEDIGANPEDVAVFRGVGHSLGDNVSTTSAFIGRTLSRI